MFGKAQSSMDEHVVRPPLRPLPYRILFTGCAPNQSIFLNCEWGEGWHDMNDWKRIWNDLKWEGLKVEVFKDEIGERGEPRENPQKSRHCFPLQFIPSDTYTRTRDLSRDRRAVQPHVHRNGRTNVTIVCYHLNVIYKIHNICTANGNYGIFRKYAFSFHISPT